MSAQPELWRVSTVEGVFETDLETLKQWILEGCVLPTDKVTKGSQSWIEAGRVPKLKEAFAGERIPLPADVSGSQLPQVEPADQSVVYGALPDVCHNHPSARPDYLCRVCNGAFCTECTRFVGSTKVPLCPLCGDLCRPYNDIKSKTVRAEFQSSGFGLSDFGSAIRYPFKHLLALVVGALIYSLLLLAGFRGSFVAWMIMFGCISHVISQVAWGRLHRSFMPDLSAFSLWDDLVVPIFLGIGITLVSWGPSIALVLALVFGVVHSGVTSSLNPITPMQSAQANAPTSEDLKVLTDPDADPKKLEEANKKLNGLRPGSVIADEAERSRNEREDAIAMGQKLMPYLGGAIVYVLLLLVFLLWGFFYYPMALTVAGYTQSFASVINPLVGLDTIRRMRLTYFKAFAMVVVIQIAGAIVGAVVGIVTSPFALPFVGNLPANFINGMVTFYFNLVIACVLGLSLYKCADRLGISVD